MSWCDCCEAPSLAERTDFQGGRGHSCWGTVQGEILSAHLFSHFFFQLAAQWLTGFHPPHMASSERHRLPSDTSVLLQPAATAQVRHPTAKPVSRVVRLICPDLALWYHAVPRLRIRFRSRLSILYRTINTILHEKQSQSLSQSLNGCAAQWDLHLKFLLPPAWTLEQRNKGQ